MRLITKIARISGNNDGDSGSGVFLNAIADGLLPDPDLDLDEWAEAHMIIPKSTGAAEYGRYRTDRTPHARHIMQSLSNKSKCRRVVLMAASQMLKTQVALNWICYTIHQHPSNILMLMPTGKLHRRIVQRIDKVFESVDVIKQRVAAPRSRLTTNSQDIKSFTGGTLYIATAGSAANLAEVPARYVAFDEIDRAEISVDGEGDPVKLAEARQTTFSGSAKSYYYSSPTLKNESRIEALYNAGTMRHALAECVHCGHPQQLEFEKLTPDAKYPCEECGGLHQEHDKVKMFASGLWSEPTRESDTESYHISAMYQPFGWLSWAEMLKEYKDASELLDIGAEEQMIVFYNTRLGKSWERKSEQTKASDLIEKAESYPLGVIPEGGLILTAAVDTQDDRFEYCCMAWGPGMVGWVVDYKIIHGDPSSDETKLDLLNTLRNAYKTESGDRELSINTKFIDSGGHHTQEIYDFAMKFARERIFAVRGKSTRGGAIIPSRPSNVHYTPSGRNAKTSAKVWLLGVDTAKDLLFSKLRTGAIHFSSYLPRSFFVGVAESEYRTTKIERGARVSVWHRNRKIANEPLDLIVYNIAAAYKIGLNRYTETHWQALANTAASKTRSSNQMEKEKERFRVRRR